MTSFVYDQHQKTFTRLTDPKMMLSFTPEMPWGVQFKLSFQLLLCVPDQV